MVYMDYIQLNSLLLHNQGGTFASLLYKVKKLSVCIFWSPGSQPWLAAWIGVNLAQNESYDMSAGISRFTLISFYLL